MTDGKILFSNICDKENVANNRFHVNQPLSLANTLIIQQEKKKLNKQFDNQNYFFNAINQCILLY